MWPHPSSMSNVLLSSSFILYFLHLLLSSPVGSSFRRVFSLSFFRSFVLSFTLYRIFSSSIRFNVIFQLDLCLTSFCVNKSGLCKALDTRTMFKKQQKYQSVYVLFRLFSLRSFFFARSPLCVSCVCAHLVLLFIFASVFVAKSLNIVRNVSNVAVDIR